VRRLAGVDGVDGLAQVVERYHRTLTDEWAHARPYTTETQRRAALPDWLHTYNNHRGHTALGGKPPASRVPNLSGQYS
jgi:transposase InsO family protein